MKLRAIAAALTVGLAITGGLVGASPASAAAFTVGASGSPGPYVMSLGSGNFQCSAAPWGRSIDLNRQIVGRSPLYPTTSQFVEMKTTVWWSSDAVTWYRGFNRLQQKWIVRTGSDWFATATFDMESFDLSPYAGYYWSVTVEFIWWVRTNTGWKWLGTAPTGFDKIGIFTYGSVTTATYAPTGEGVCYIP